MNKVGKVLVVFMAVASLCFMAFAAAVLLGGPNWAGMAEDLKDYSFEVTHGDATSYSMKGRGEGSTFSAQSENPAEVVVKALQDKKTRLQNQEQALDGEIQQLQQLLETRKNLKEMDVAALQARQKEFQDMLTRINERITQVNEETRMQEEQIIAEQQKLVLHREDVLRLRDQLELVRADRERLIERSQELADIQALLKASIGQMQRRTEQLTKQQQSYDEEATVNN